MTNHTNEKERQSSLIHQKIRKAAFVQYETPKSENYKYSYLYKIRKLLINLVTNAKRFTNSAIQKLWLVASKFDWKTVIKDSTLWIIEATIEGITINFATFALFHFPFNIATVIAYGIIVKQGLSIYWRLRNNGPTSNIPKKDEFG